MIHYDETHYILYPRRLYTFCIYIRYDLHLIFDKATMFPTIPTRFSALESVGFRPTNPPGPMEKPVCPLVETSSFFHHRNTGNFGWPVWPVPKKRRNMEDIHGDVGGSSSHQGFQYVSILSHGPNDLDEKRATPMTGWKPPFFREIWGENVEFFCRWTLGHQRVIQPIDDAVTLQFQRWRW